MFTSGKWKFLVISTSILMCSCTNFPITPQFRCVNTSLPIYVINWQDIEFYLHTQNKTDKEFAYSIHSIMDEMLRVNYVIKVIYKNDIKYINIFRWKGKLLDYSIGSKLHKSGSSSIQNLLNKHFKGWLTYEFL